MEWRRVAAVLAIAAPPLLALPLFVSEFGARAVPDKNPNRVQKPVETRETTPGQGNLPPLPDRDEVAPLTPEDATAHLERAADRINRERREYRRRPPPTLRHVKDW